MIKKKYVLLLCEDEFDGEQFIDKRRLEIASSDSTFMGQAQNIMFYTKIDGTHELSFELNKFYFDENSGNKVKNELVDRLVNKCKIEAIIEQPNGEMKSFFMVVNKREDKKEGKIISYSYSCTDSFIEELSKTGYNLEFSDDIELQGSGMGTIGELAEKIVEGTDWEFVEENTDTLYEYTTDLEYDFSQERYNEVYTPVPSHMVKYIPEIEGFANKMVPYKKITVENEDTQEVEDHYHPIYCFEDSNSITTNTVQNILYNTNDCTDTIGWEGYGYNNRIYDQSLVIIEPTKRNQGDAPERQYYDLTAYCLNAQAELILTNSTATTTRTKIEKNKFYLFRYDKVIYNTEQRANANTLRSITISSAAPGQTSKKTMTAIGKDTDTSSHTGFAPNTYYVLRPTDTINNPYFSFNFGRHNYHKDNKLELTRLEFFELTGVDEDANLYLINKYSAPDKSKLEPEDYEKVVFLPEFVEDTNDYDYLSSYWKVETKCFIRENEYYVNGQLIDNTSLDTEQNLTYLDFVNEVNTDSNYIKNGNNWTSFSPLEIDPTLYEEDQIEEGSRDRGAAELDTIYYCGKDGRYYQYYYLDNVKVNGQISSGGMWGLALLGNGKNDKIRTLVGSKSNRFNLIQDLAELFKVWPVFNMYRDETGKIKKQFWFKECCLNENFAGFHAGVNVRSLTRTVDSDEIVTKMYVEDRESQYTDDGLVTITTAKLNPLMENFCYNFRYYVEQKLLNQTMLYNGITRLLIEVDLEKLYETVKPLNQNIYDLQVRNVDLSYDLEDILQRRKGLSYQISSAQLMIRDLTEDENRASDFGGNTVTLSETDKAKIEENKSSWQAVVNKALEEDAILEGQEKTLQTEFDNNNAAINEKMQLKIAAIETFEKKYAQYIKEGTWSDSDYVDNDQYYYDAQKVSNTSAEPKVSWTIGVLDGNCFEELQEFKVQVGDKTFLIDPDFFDNKNSTYKFEILISGYKDYLDNPTKNEIEVRNYLTSFEDLFQRIAAATQTLTLNEQTYDKAALLTSQGIDVDIFQKTLNDNALVLLNSENKVGLDQSGLSLQSIFNPAAQLRAVAEGIFISDSTDGLGNPVWKTGITAKGINANIITAGKINTSEVDIYCGDQIGFQWNSLGITARQPSNQKYRDDQFVRFDGFGLYFINGINNFNFNQDGTPWYSGKKYDEGISNIVNNAEVSLTRLGFNMNIKKDNGRLTLGYKLDEVLNITDDEHPWTEIVQTSHYGLYIEKGNKEIIRLQDDGDCMIGGWKITSQGLSFEIGTEGEGDYGYCYFWSDPRTIGSVLGFESENGFINLNGNGSINATGYIEVGYEDSLITRPSLQNGDGYFHNNIYLAKNLYIWDNNQWKVVDFSSGGGGGSGDFIVPVYPNGENDPVMASAWWESYSGHKGLDLVLKNGDQYGKPVYASRAGTVDDVYSSWDPSQGTSGMRSYGNYIRINHGDYQGSNYKTRYAHLLSLVVNIGDHVSQGQLIGYMDSTGNVTGPHLHFEIIKNGVRVNPELYLPPVPHK